MAAHLFEVDQDFTLLKKVCVCVGYFSSSLFFFFLLSHTLLTTVENYCIVFEKKITLGKD